MCGIAGYLTLNREPAAISLVRRMTDAIAHRGPDGDGFWVEGPVAFGHRRLAIIDLSDGGRQPMQTPDGRFTITFNGEIYNYAELKAQLRALGHMFHSTSDTEVLLHSIAQWGIEGALPRLNGMFAFGLWDSQRRELTLARDRFGVKPLYWHSTGKAVLFASEIKAILAHPSVCTSIDVDALSEYLIFQNFHTDRTLFAGMRMLPAGSFVTIRSSDGRLPEPYRYYKMRFSEPDQVPEPAEAVAQLEYLFKQAVSRQLVADVELGAYLSGGIDSGAITGVAATELSHLRTFTCGFDLSSASGLEVYFDERHDAEMMSARWHTEHYEMVLKAGDMERIIPKLVWHLEEPRVGQCYPNFYIAGLASKFNRVVLGGTGGDELFGGYPWRYLSAFGDDSDALMENTFATWQRLFPHSARDTYFAPMLAELSGPTAREIFESVIGRPAPQASPEERMHAVLTYEANTFLLGLLTMEDKVSMAHGLESRVPFLDNDLVDFATSLPLHYKFGLPASEIVAQGRGIQRSTDGKRLLRQAVAGLVPPEVMAREKQGFSAPDAGWFKGQSIDYVKSRIGTKRARIYNFIDYDSTNALLQEHFAGIRNNRLLIWSLIYLEQALEIWNLA